MRLGFYINPIAQLRDSERVKEPEPAIISSQALFSGAQIIIAGWTQSGGLLSERDLRVLREVIHGDLFILAPLGEEHIEAVIKFRPEGVILVSSGWDGIRDFHHVQVEVDSEQMASQASIYKVAGIQTFALIEPEPNNIKTIARCDLTGVVIDTSEYAAAGSIKEAEETIEKLADTALAANKFELVTAAGHGLNYQNVGPIAGLRYIEEILVGRSIVARSVSTGIQSAVKEMVNTIDRNYFVACTRR